MIPLPNVSGKILAKVIEYCKKHVDAKGKEGDAKSSTNEDELKNWDTEFVKVLDQSTLFELILVSCVPLSCTVTKCSGLHRQLITPDARLPTT